MNELYYDGPIQLYYSVGVGPARRGIGFHEYIIDLETGSFLTTKQVFEMGKIANIREDNIVLEICHWKPLS